MDNLCDLLSTLSEFGDAAVVFVDLRGKSPPVSDNENHEDEPDRDFPRPDPPGEVIFMEMLSRAGTQAIPLHEKFFAKKQLHKSLYTTFGVATLEFMDTEFYDCSLLFSDKAKTKEDRFCDLSRATRVAFITDNAELNFWSMLDKAVKSGNESALLTLRLFLTNYIGKDVAEYMKKNHPNQNFSPGKFLLNPGILWQLYFNSALLNQWLMMALFIVLKHEACSISLFKHLPIPEQLAPGVQDLLMFFRDLWKRLNYGFALLSYLVKIHPNTDEQVTKLIMEDVVAPVLASIRVILNEEHHFEKLCVNLPKVILTARQDGSFGKDVFINPRNYSVDQTVENFDTIYTIRYWVLGGESKECFGSIKTKIEDLKATINESKMYQFMDKMPIFVSSLDRAANALYLTTDLASKVHDLESYKNFLSKVWEKNDEVDISRGSKLDSCLLTLLHEEQRALKNSVGARTFVMQGKKLEVVANLSVVEETIILVKSIEKRKLQKQAAKYLKEWDGKNCINPFNFLEKLDLSNQKNSIEAKTFRLAKQMVCFKSSPGYPYWTFNYCILPTFVNCFRTNKKRAKFEHKLSEFFLEELLSLLTKDHDAWRSGSGHAEFSTKDHLSEDESYVTSLIDWRKKFLDRICHAVSKTCKNVTAPIERFNKLLSLNAANTLPTLNDIMTATFQKLAFDWMRKSAYWINMIMFSLTEAISKCAAEPSINLKNLILAIHTMIELVSLFETQSTKFNAQRKELKLRLQTLDDAYLELMGENKALSKSKGVANTWQKLGLILHLLYEMCKTVKVPKNYKPPTYYPEDSKLIIMCFAERKLDKLKIAIASICIDAKRQDQTWTTVEVMKNSPENMFTPCLERIKEGKIRSWDEDVLIPVKHCRFCGKVNVKLMMCTACKDMDEYPDIHWFCGDKCEANAFKKTNLRDDHENFILDKMVF
ncbi:uncharacterized protein LOC132202923 isoform X2 [Neocloeon triangulifer]|uniref:uncharacterized protein LOC132202923 isoform X2 n=1 Tax=Neocloeon triangulifer TaxID=2078957 RepID=UPI00286EBF5B|nr:uncharacterized protein LOC132202923 isoform X2 [Neocloeon triangulifer]